MSKIWVLVKASDLLFVAFLLSNFLMNYFLSHLRRLKVQGPNLSEYGLWTETFLSQIEIFSFARGSSEWNVNCADFESGWSVNALPQVLYITNRLCLLMKHEESHLKILIILLIIIRVIQINQFHILFIIMIQIVIIFTIMIICQQIIVNYTKTIKK